jgi:hypothetical protein
MSKPTDFTFFAEENSNLRAGQTVIGRVQHVDSEKRRFTLQLKVWIL